MTPHSLSYLSCVQLPWLLVCCHGHHQTSLFIKGMFSLVTLGTRESSGKMGPKRGHLKGWVPHDLIQIIFLKPPLRGWLEFVSFPPVLSWEPCSGGFFWVDSSCSLLVFTTTRYVHTRKVFCMSLFSSLGPLKLFWSLASGFEEPELNSSSHQVCF